VVVGEVEDGALARGVGENAAVGVEGGGFVGGEELGEGCAPLFYVGSIFCGEVDAVGEAGWADGVEVAEDEGNDAG
jgi:hypothetical protein